jgi:hypothetical protein
MDWSGQHPARQPVLILSTMPDFKPVFPFYLSIFHLVAEQLNTIGLL